MNYVFFVRWRTISQFSSYPYYTYLFLLHVRKRMNGKRTRDYIVQTKNVGKFERSNKSLSESNQSCLYPYLFYCLHTQFDVKNLLTHLGSIYVDINSPLIKCTRKMLLGLLLLVSFSHLILLTYIICGICTLNFKLNLKLSLFTFIIENCIIEQFH